MSCGNCDGRCCSVFTFPHPPEFLQFRHETHNGFKDDKMLGEMLIPLTYEEATERAARFGVGNIDKMKDAPLYTCKNWDEETRLCTVYDERPDMCRYYPYGRECDHGCGYKLPQAEADAAPGNWATLRVEPTE